MQNISFFPPYFFFLSYWHSFTLTIIPMALMCQLSILVEYYLNMTVQMFQKVHFFPNRNSHIADRNIPKPPISK